MLDSAAGFCLGFLHQADSMSDPELIKMRCPQCDGGVEFPARWDWNNELPARIARWSSHLKGRLQKVFRFLAGYLLVIVLVVAAASGWRMLIWHHPSPAELKAIANW